MALEEGGADALCIETMGSLAEALQAVRAAKDHTKLPVICTFTFDKKPRGFFTMMGATPEKVATELVAAGGRPRRLVLSGLDSLTSSERRTAQLAAAGLSNREIAQNLFITTRIVEGHLTHAYQKLAITSREQLPAALAPPDRGPAVPAPAPP